MSGKSTQLLREWWALLSVFNRLTTDIYLGWPQHLWSMALAIAEKIVEEYGRNPKLKHQEAIGFDDISPPAGLGQKVWATKT